MKTETKTNDRLVKFNNANLLQYSRVQRNRIETMLMARGWTPDDAVPAGEWEMIVSESASND
jgi:hypothetical protein